MRIVTRPDFDGIVCAMLLYEVENITEPIKWVSPNDMQKQLIEVKEGDIIANLPYHPNCSLWFDHHYSNQITKTFKGSFELSPSAARVIFEHYKIRFNKYYQLINETDKIDSASLSVDEVNHPENYPYILLSMTIFSHRKEDESYWNRLVELLKKYEINEILIDPEVKIRCLQIVEQNRNFKKLLEDNTQFKDHVAITDFRSFSSTPEGNRFLIYSMYPKSSVHVSISYDDNDKNQIVVRVGYNIFNKDCYVNVGKMLSNFQGGGHSCVGSCRFNISKADEYIPKIIDILLKNKSE